VNLTSLPIDLGLALLRSRTNWTSIELPSIDDSETASLASLNQTDFALCVNECNSSMSGWLRNPHLTALRFDVGPLPSDCWRHCPNAKTSQI
jgi:hypothetical protein